MPSVGSRARAVICESYESRLQRLTHDLAVGASRMSTICDSCKQPVYLDEGCARIMINDPSPDFRALPVDAVLPIFRRAPQLDLCAQCLVKLITALSLPPDTFTPRLSPVASVVPTGILTEEDLVKLGLKET